MWNMGYITCSRALACSSISLSESESELDEESDELDICKSFVGCEAATDCCYCFYEDEKLYKLYYKTPKTKEKII